MKCEICGGAIVHDPGNSLYPPRLVCMACGREPKGKEDKMEEKKKTCSKCLKEMPATIEFFPKNQRRSDGLESHCKACKNKYQRDLRKLAGKDNKPKIRRKTKRYSTQKASDPKPTPQAVAEGIFLDQALIKAIKRSVAKVIIGIIEEKFV